MKGAEYPLWVIVAVILALIILIALVYLILTGQLALDWTFTDADLWACCGNIRANGCDPSGVTCVARDGQHIALSDLANKLGITPQEAAFRCGCS